MPRFATLDQGVNQIPENPSAASLKTHRGRIAAHERNQGHFQKTAR
jgi:hypothetical protein